MTMASGALREVDPAPGVRVLCRFCAQVTNTVKCVTWPVAPTNGVLGPDTVPAPMDTSNTTKTVCDLAAAATRDVPESQRSDSSPTIKVLVSGESEPAPECTASPHPRPRLRALLRCAHI